MAETEIKVVGLSSNKSGGKTNWKIISAIIGIVVLSIGVIAGIILVNQQQNISEKASQNNFCPEAEACPGSDGVLRNCHPPADDGGPSASLCNRAGRIEFCGTRNYCCPSVGGAWTPDMTACAVVPTATSISTATSTATASSTATATSTSKATSTATSTATSKATSTTKSTATSKVTAKATATAFPVPETGMSLPTILGTGFGIIMILLSLGLAL